MTNSLARRLRNNLPFKPLFGVKSKWTSVASNRREEFRRLLERDSDQKYFDKDFIKDIADRADALEKRYWKTIFVHSAILIVLIASIFQSSPELSILSVKIADFSKIKEELLFIGAALIFIIIVMKADLDDLRLMLDVIVEKTTPRDTWPFTKRRYDKAMGSLPPVVRPRKVWMLGTGWHKVQVAVTLIYVGIYICALVPASTWAQVIILHDVWTKPNLPWVWSKLIVVFYVSQMSLYLVLGLYTKIPMPFRDYTLLMKLSDLKSANPQAHERRMAQLRRIYRGTKLRKVRA